MGKQHRSTRLLVLLFVLVLLIYDVCCIGFVSYVKSIERAAVAKEVLGFSIHPVYADHFKANPYSKDVLLSSVHSEEGYVAIRNDTDERLLVNLAKNDGDTLIYTANPGVTYCLLTDGVGSYDVICGKQGESALLQDVVKTDNDEDELYTYPNTYAMFTPDGKLTEFCATFPTDEKEYMNAICQYLSTHGVYTTEGDRLESWYIPNPETFIETFEGDCFDFASFVTAAFRMRGIPCKLVVGTCSDEGHAWIEVKSPYTGNLGGYPVKKGEWCMVDPTVFVSMNVDYGVSSVVVGGYSAEHKDLYKANFCY